MKKISIKKKIGLIIFGVFLALFLLEIGLRIEGFVISSLQEQRNKISLQKKADWRILCLGDSNTASGGENSYPSQLEKTLNKKTEEGKFGVINKGIDGANSTIVLERLKENLDKYNPDIVTVMMGVIDSPPLRSEEGYEEISIIENKSFLENFKTYKLINLLKENIKKEKEKKEENKNIDTNSFTKTTDLKEKEKILKEKIKENPSDEDYIGLARFLKEQERSKEAEEILKKAIEINPKTGLYTELARFLKEEKRLKEAEEIFKKAVKMNPTRKMYIELGRFLKVEKKFKEAEEVLKKAAKLYPSSIVYVILEGVYEEQGKDKEAEEMLKEAIEMSSDKELYSELQRCFKEQQRYDIAKKTFKGLVIEPSPSTQTYIILGKCYQEEKKFKEAIEMLEKAINLVNLEPTRQVYLKLAQVYEAFGKEKEAREAFKKVIEKKAKEINPITNYNYQKLQEMVTERGIKLVAIQYPSQSVEPLKEMLEPKENTIFVDNEKTYHDAIRHGSYNEYFVDDYARDFGHCTSKGNKLLAENIANAILENYFKK